MDYPIGIEFSLEGNARQRSLTVFRVDEPGLPVGPRYELRGGDWKARGEDDGG